jgi:ATP-binding cassette subfamily F protein 3
VGLVGRNGHGKTTLFRIILGQEAPDSGTISMPNQYITGHLSQHIRFTEASVLKEACLALIPSQDGRDETYRAETILHGLGFSTEDFQKDPMKLSGGYQVRLNLAKVLVSEPNLLLLDEPTNYLDILSIRWLIRFLKTWKNELILITHDRTFMDKVTTHTMGIHRCRIKKIAGSTYKYYEQIIQEEEIHEKTRINDEKKRGEAEQFIERFRAKASKAKAVQSRIKALQRRGRLDKLSEIETLDFSFNAVPFSGKWLMQAENLRFAFDPEGTMLIQDLNFFVGKHDRIGIIGQNGKGKTTLLNLLADELTPMSGKITRHTNMKSAYFGQTNIDRLQPDKTVEQEILDVQPDSNRKAARSICGAMMFEGDQALKKVEVLSGGERSRVLLGKLLVSPANLLLLDEPSNHLDMESTESLLEAIDAFEGAVLFVTHMETLLHAIATRLIVFDDGKVQLFEGTYQDFLDRVGWKSEDLTRLYNKKKERMSSKGMSKKEMRRIRSEIITQRSNALGDLQTGIVEIEQTIMRLETKVEQETHDLMNASQRGEGEAINQLSKSLHESKKKIEHLFNELEELTIEHDRKALEFDAKLDAL